MKNSITSLLLLLSFSIFAQENKKCFTSELIQKELEINEDYQNQIYQVHKDNKKWLSENSRSKETITIPIVVYFALRYFS